jgi:hypothetical protein
MAYANLLIFFVFLIPFFCGGASWRKFFNGNIEILQVEIVQKKEMKNTNRFVSVKLKVLHFGEMKNNSLIYFV